MQGPSLKAKVAAAAREARWLLAYWRLRRPRLPKLSFDNTAILVALKASPIPLAPLRVDAKAWREFVRQAQYAERHPGYYTDNLAEKSLEHFVVAQLLDPRRGETYVDIASESGTAAEIYGRLHGVNAFAQDLSFAPGIHGNRIGGDAGRLPLPDESVDALGLHCSFEHFEGDSDTRFIHEAGRVLRPGGRCVIAPLCLYQFHACVTDPLVAAKSRVQFDKDATVIAMRGWRNRHGRLYDVPHLIERVWNARGPLEMTIRIVENASEADPSCYLRYAAVFRKLPSGVRLCGP